MLTWNYQAGGGLRTCSRYEIYVLPLRRQVTHGKLFLYRTDGNSLAAVGYWSDWSECTLAAIFSPPIPTRTAFQNNSGGNYFSIFFYSTTFAMSLLYALVSAFLDV